MNMREALIKAAVQLQGRYTKARLTCEAKVEAINELLDLTDELYGQVTDTQPGGTSAAEQGVSNSGGETAPGSRL